MKKYKHNPVSVAWELTLECNMNCMHCGSSAGKSRSDELTTKEALNLCSMLNELNVKIVSLTGGEPLLRKDWYTIGNKIKDHGMELAILSNGYIINEKIINQLKKLEIYGISISLDGGRPETHDTIRRLKGAYDKCISSIQLLRDAGFDITVITSVNKNNIKELPIIRDLLICKGIMWQVQIAAPTGRFPKDDLLSREDFYSVAMFISSCRNQFSLKELPIIGAHNFGYHSKKLRNIMFSPIWRGCQAGISVLGIQSNGSVKGCLSLPDSFIEDNIRNRHLVEIWNDPSFSYFNRNFKKENLGGYCKECKYGNSCRGGCETVSVSVTGNLHCNPYCLYAIENELF